MCEMFHANELKGSLCYEYLDQVNLWWDHRRKLHAVYEIKFSPSFIHIQRTNYAKYVG